MTCYHPITCIYPSLENSDGKRPLLFTLPESWRVDRDTPLIRDVSDKSDIKGFKIKVPCGRCIGCRLDYSRHWAIRSMHEAKMHQDNCFVTLTYDDDHLPDNRSLSKSYIQSWMKRFRYKYGNDIRFMICGEYGAKTQRPHYHILFYGFNFPDRYVWSCRRGNIYYRSPGLEELWRDAGCSKSNGFSVIGDVTFESSAYVARYITKKIFGAESKKYYSGREPEFLNMSRMPGLGNEFFYKYWQDMYNLGYIVMDNKGKKFKAPIPRYYDYLLSSHSPDVYFRYKLDKRNQMINNLFKENIDESTQRLEVREELQKLKLDKLLRFYEISDFLHNIYYNHISRSYKKAIRCLKLNDFTFEVNFNDARQAIIDDKNTYNYIFLDAFTPAKCPCLWTVDFFKLLHKHLDNNGMILTYSNSASVRNAFIQAGFWTGKIYNKENDKFMGTIATKNLELIKYGLSEYDLGLINTKAGIVYRDEDLNADNGAILLAHASEVAASCLQSSSKFIKTFRGNK